MANKPLNIIFLGRKPAAVSALNFLKTKGQNIKLVVAPKNENFKKNLYNSAQALKLTTLADESEIYKLIKKGDSLIKNIDLVISCLHSSKIKEPLLSLPKIGALNFHPGPLPDYKGWASYNYAILNSLKLWGTTAHFMDKNFDTGPIIKVKKFKINLENETAFSLERKTQKALSEIFEETLELIISNKRLLKKKNTGGVSCTKKEMEAAKIINFEKESSSAINRKIRAYFFPPHSGAKIIKDGHEYTLINKEILKYLHKNLQ